MESLRKDILTKLANGEISIDNANYQINQLDSQHKIVNINTGYLTGFELVETTNRITPFVEEDLIEHLQSLKTISYQNFKELIAKNVKKQYIDELGYLGYTELSVDEQVLLVMHGISPDYIWDLQTAGNNGMEVSLIVTIRQTLDQEEIVDLTSVNCHPSQDQVVEMKIQVSLLVQGRK